MNEEDGPPLCHAHLEALNVLADLQVRVVLGELRAEDDLRAVSIHQLVVKNDVQARIVLRQEHEVTRVLVFQVVLSLIFGSRRPGMNSSRSKRAEEAESGGRTKKKEKIEREERKRNKTRGRGRLFFTRTVSSGCERGMLLGGILSCRAKASRMEPIWAGRPPAKEERNER